MNPDLDTGITFVRVGRGRTRFGSLSTAADKHPDPTRADMPLGDPV